MLESLKNPDFQNSSTRFFGYFDASFKPSRIGEEWLYSENELQHDGHGLLSRGAKFVWKKDNHTACAHKSFIALWKFSPDCLKSISMLCYAVCAIGDGSLAAEKVLPCVAPQQTLQE